jgi:hypothetical protein
MILTVTFACIFFHVIYAWGVGRIYIYVCVCMSRQVLTRNMIMYEYSTQVHSLWYNEYIRIYLYLFLKCYVYIYIIYMHACSVYTAYTNSSIDIQYIYAVSTHTFTTGQSIQWTDSGLPFDRCPGALAGTWSSGFGPQHQVVGKLDIFRHGYKVAKRHGPVLIDGRMVSYTFMSSWSTLTSCQVAKSLRWPREMEM